MFVNGFSAFASPSRTGVKSFRVPGTLVVLPVKAEVAPLLIGFAKEFHQKVEPLKPGWNWGWAFRAVRGSSKPSFHSAGVAIDLNAPRHPLGRRGTFNRKQVAVINALCAKYGLRWGGNYRVRKDEMHFEVIIPRHQALNLVRRLQSKPAVVNSRPSVKPAPGRTPVRPNVNLPKHATGSRVLKEGMVGTDVRDIQHAMNILGNSIVEDGQFGPILETVVKNFQRNRGLRSDGIVGPATLARIRKDIH